MNYSKVFFILFFLLFVGFVNANIAVNVLDVSESENFVDAKIELISTGGIQPNIRYGLLLGQQRISGLKVFDEFFFDDLLSVNSEYFIERNLRYEIPNFLDGAYELWFIANSDSGSVLSLFPLHKINLKSSQGFIELKDTNCYLKIKDVNGVFSLLEGVSVDPKEELIFVCSLKNNYSKTILAYPKFETYLRKSFGVLIDEKIDYSQSITLSPNLEKEIELVLPKALIPQAYDIKLSFFDGNLRLNSNQSIIHYVLHGLSASIHWLKINKSNFVAGEIADVNFFWTPSADSFSDSRLSSNFKDGKAKLLLFEKDLLCAQKEIFLTSEELVLTKLPIKNDCLATRLQISLIDFSGNVLYVSDLNLIVENENKEFFEPVVFNYGPSGDDLLDFDDSQTIIGLFVGLIIIIFIVGVIFIILKKKGKI
jgi:hypothetical protein